MATETRQVEKVVNVSVGAEDVAVVKIFLYTTLFFQCNATHTTTHNATAFLPPKVP